MGISLRTHKILWARSGGKCSICKNDLIQDHTEQNDDLSVIGDEAHIIARNESFTRGDYEPLSPEERDQYSNLILLCKNHHKQVDDQPHEFSVDKLREIKRAHEEQVKSLWTDADAKKQEDEITYAAYIDVWERSADLDNWRNISSWICDNTPVVPKYWYDAQKEFLIWLLGRIWPRRHLLLEQALFNYSFVLQDFFKVFDRHLDPAGEADSQMQTERFYKIREWDPDRYSELSARYEAHVGLVCDLFFELTRAANYLCDRVRETIFSGYRIKEGVLIIERSSVGFRLETVRSRLEYRGEERTPLAYPGLSEFKQVRYARDHALDPQDPTVEDLDDGIDF
jgi:hypothetical protein